MNQILSPGFEVAIGLNQACGLSLTLFTIFLDRVQRKWKQETTNMGLSLTSAILYILYLAMISNWRLDVHGMQGN